MTFCSEILGRIGDSGLQEYLNWVLIPSENRNPPDKNPTPEVGMGFLNFGSATWSASRSPPPFRSQK